MSRTKHHPIIQTSLTLLSHEDGGRKSHFCLTAGGFMPHIVIQSPDVRVSKVVNGVCVDDYLGVRILPTKEDDLRGIAFECDMELMYYPHVDYDLHFPKKSPPLHSLKKGSLVMKVVANNNHNERAKDGYLDISF